MAAVTFDTLKFVETLERANVPREQASAIASAVRDAQDLSDVATKQDLRELESATDSKFDLLRKDIDLLRSDVRKDIDLLRSDMSKEIDLLRSDMRGENILTRWMLGILTAGMGTILVKLFWG